VICLKTITAKAAETLRDDYGSLGRPDFGAWGGAK